MSYAPQGSGQTLKRELVFPIDSVEATTPVLYKRRRLGRGDVAPIEAWRIMMALKSGLLAETCWALDVLNILLFDDSTVAYFGLVHLPGLMDILLEHMKKALADMLEQPPLQCGGDERANRVSRASPPPSPSPLDNGVDLGAVATPPDPSDRISLLKGPDYSMKSRKGRSVCLHPESDDIFVTDGKRCWDTQDVVEESVEPDTSYIVPCFRSEFGKIPFVRLLPSKERRQGEPPLPSIKCEDTSSKAAPDPSPPVKVEKKDTNKGESGGSASSQRESKTVVSKPKSKCLSDVLSRIKREDSINGEIDHPHIKEEVVEKEGVTTPPPTQADLQPFCKIKEEEPDDDEMERYPEGEEEEEDDDYPDEDEDKSSEGLRVRDPAGILKRRRISDYEDECYTKDEASLHLVSENQDSIARRCVCLSTILRNLTFVPGNECEFSKNGTFLGLIGKLLLLHHEHPPRVQRNYDREEDMDIVDPCPSLQGDGEWWWEFLHHLRENALVSIANIAGHVDLGLYPEDVSRPILDGLLHWAVCPAAQGRDPFPTVSPSSSLSPQRLALEALCKLSVTDSNVDLVIATPPYCRLERLSSVLTKLLCRSEEQVLREFAVNLLYYLGAADSGMARTIALQTTCIPQLVSFIEQAEQSAMNVANQHGLSALRDNPDCMGTSLDMLRRAAKTLLHLSKHPDNRPLFLPQEQRLLALVMSQVLDQQVASIISMVLFQVARCQVPMAPAPLETEVTPALQEGPSS